MVAMPISAVIADDRKLVVQLPLEIQSAGIEHSHSARSSLDLIHEEWGTADPNQHS